MQNIAKIREMMGQIGGACVQITLGCEDAQHQEFELDVLQELESALGELHANARKLRQSSMSSTIDPELDHDGKTDPAHEIPEPVELTEAEARKVLELVIHAERCCYSTGLGPSAVGSFMAGYTARILGDDAIIDASARRPTWPLPSGK